MKIAILGMGNIGGGVADELLRDRDEIAAASGQDVEIKYVLDLRDFPGHPLEDKIVHSIDTIINDPEVGLVAETMGGSHPAREYTLAALRAGKHVVTSNKEVVSNFGDEFLAEAAAHGVFYLFEASVGGGIPLIRPITDSLASEQITAVDGIVNGTTNYILTRVSCGTPFDDALAEAQRLGYAERDPSADVDAIDSQRKITILAALTSGKLSCPSRVRAETIRSITPDMIALASKLGGTIKLIAHAAPTEDDKLDIFAAPCFVPCTSPLAYISDVYNGVLLDCSRSGKLMFFGQGAGKYPTAGSIIADIVAAVSGTARRCRPLIRDEAGHLLPYKEHVCRHFITASKDVCGEVKAFAVPEEAVYDFDEGGTGLAAFILPPCKHGDIEALAEKYSQISVFRII